MEFITAEEITRKYSMRETMAAIELFYTNDNVEFLSPDRMHIEDGKNTALLMPAFYGDYYAAKLVGVAPGNSELGKNTIHGLMILYDRHTMVPLFLCDAVAITSLRTGALGGLGMKYLGREDARTLGIIGTGTQGWSHLQSALVARDITQVHIFNRTKEKAEAFKKKAESTFPNVTFHTSSMIELITQSEIIVTTTTSSSPVLPDLNTTDLKGKLFVAVGSFRPDMQELSDQVLQEADELYVDASSALHESGDMLRARELRHDVDDTRDLNHMISHQYSPEDLHKKTVVFKSVGAAIFDLVVTQSIYEKFDQS